MSKDDQTNETFQVGTVLFNHGDKINSDFWDDSELIEHWDRTIEAYRKKYSNKVEGSPPPFQKVNKVKKTYKKIKAKKTTNTQQGNINNTRTSMPSEHSIPAIPSIPPMPTLPNMPPTASSSNSQEDLSNLMMAWYYCGYYTGIYQAQKESNSQS